jgi:hypothetical protein
MTAEGCHPERSEGSCPHVVQLPNDLRIASAARSLLFHSFAAELWRWAATQ